MMTRKYLTIAFSWLIAPFCLAQEDEKKVLGPEKFMEIVQNHHPVARQADIQVAKGDAALRSSRGGFDPKLYGDYSQKYYDEKTYYGLFDGGLKIPTWFGMELKTGIEKNEGVYLNPENNVPDAGLWYAGVSIPVGQGLFIDKRRAELRQAEIYSKSSRLDRQLIRNQLLYDAGKSYWDWFMAYHNLQVYENALQLAQERFQAVKQSALLGDNPAIDTLEAGIQVQNRRLGLQSAQLDYANTSALLSIYLWSDGIIPLEISEETTPIPLDSVTSLQLEATYFSQLDSMINNHPELQQYRYKIDQLTLDKRLKREQIKPKLNLNYFALSEPIGENPMANLSTNNYKWGLEFSMPILLRKERGELKLANLKLEETEMDIKNKLATIEFKVQASVNEWLTTLDQIELYNQTVRDYLGLLNGERQLFNAGESSLFLLNSRELGYIQAQLKLIELVSKNNKSILTTRYNLGELAVE